MKGHFKRLVVSAMAATLLVTSTMSASAADIKDFFDAKWYAEKYPDLKAAYGDNAELLYQHYLTHGISEGRNASNVFDVRMYREMYKDLAEAFGDNWAAYLNHYISFGLSEKRDGGGEFDLASYAERYPDLVAVYGYDLAAMKNHYDTIGKAENRVASSEAASKSVAHSGSSSSKGSSSSSDSSSCAPTNPSVDVDALLEEVTSCFLDTLELWIAYQDDCDFGVTNFTVVDYNLQYAQYEKLCGKLYGTGNTECIEAWETYYAEILSDEGLTEEDNFYYISGYVEVDGTYYDQIAYQYNHMAWAENMPVPEDYLIDTDYQTEYDAWEAREPQLEDYTIGYATEEAATEAYEADHEAWDEGKPVLDDFDDEDAFNEAMEAYVAEHPEPQEEDYVYYEDGFADEDAATSAFDTAYSTWEANVPDENDYLSEEDYQAAYNTYISEHPEPQEENYKYYEDGYVSEEAASAAFDEAHTDWENAKESALGELEVGTDGYNTALEDFLAENSEPTEDTYLAKVNKYASEEAATEAYETAHQEWENAKPVATNYKDADAYNEAMVEYEASEPELSDYTGKVNTYESQDDADAQYEEDYTAWEEGAPKQADYKDSEAYEAALNEYLANNAEPQREDYVLGDYADADAANSAYESDHTTWESEAPEEEDYLGDTSYEEDYAAWEEREPELEDFPVEEEDMVEEPRTEIPALG